MKNKQNIDECLHRFDAKANALRDLIEVMNKHNLTFEASMVGNKVEVRIMQDYFKDGDPITLFSVNDNIKSSIDYVQISRG